MQFKAFSSRIESRALGTIALLSLLPIAVLCFGVWQQTERMAIRNFEDGLHYQISHFSLNTNHALSSLAARARTIQDPREIHRLRLVKHDPEATPPSANRLPANSKPHLTYTDKRLWLATSPASDQYDPNIFEINQSILMEPMRRLFPNVHFCLSFHGAYEAVCETPPPDGETFLAKRQLDFSKNFSVNFDPWVIATIPKQAATEGSAQFFKMFLATMFMASLIGIIASTLANRRALAPLAELSRGTNALRNRNYDVKLDIQTDDEFEDLGAAFNSMTETLRASNRFTAALSQVDQLILKTTDLERVIRSVLNAIKTIETANDAWVLTLGHETMPAERLYWVDNEGSLDSSDTSRWSDEMPLIPQVADVNAANMSNISGLTIAETFPVILDEQVVAVLLIGATDEATVENTNSRHYGELSSRLSVAMTHIDRSLTLYRQANQDALTGLLNRQAFERDLRQQCINCQRDNTKSALLFIDLDRFKQVNDTEGHKAGDRLLLVIARRLQQSLRPEDIIARLGGDEFAVLLQDVRATDDSACNAALIETCERIISRLSKPVVVERLEHSIHASIGIAYIDASFAVADQILSRADVAMYHAKTKAGCNYAFYDPKLNSESEQRIQLESRLRQALTSDDIKLHFQPQLNLASGEITGVEGLIRWQSELNGNVPPSLFIPIAEDSGIIHELEPLIFDYAAQLVARTAGTPHEVRRVAVNVSVQQLALPGFAKRVFRYLEQTGLRPEQLEIEVTESLFIKEMALVVDELSELRQAGIVIALDDFGTGYSSLSYLRTLPIDIIKIDRSFVQEIEESTEARDLIQSILHIAKALNKTVVAEGVETHAQLDVLRRMGCDTMQGYLFSRPLPESELNSFMAEHDNTRWSYTEERNGPKHPGVQLRSV